MPKLTMSDSHACFRKHNGDGDDDDDDDDGDGDDQVPRRQGEDGSGCLHCALNVSLAALSDYKGRPR